MVSFAQSDSGLLPDQGGLAPVLRKLPQTAQQCNPLRPTNAIRRARQIAEGRNRGGQAPACGTKGFGHERGAAPDAVPRSHLSLSLSKWEPQEFNCVLAMLSLPDLMKPACDSKVDLGISSETALALGAIAVAVSHKEAAPRGIRVHGLSMLPAHAVVHIGIRHRDRDAQVTQGTSPRARAEILLNQIREPGEIKVSQAVRVPSQNMGALSLTPCGADTSGPLTNGASPAAPLVAVDA